ncbi:hypothetical protein [Bradyrhizobium australafricanum]|uniref:hypothetical protein n=1 Tax=Bradyrhizobium australafricanum TaxID=2821406 RepID=UPI001CE3276D|nr:hypothetical protein [Bradyrhizobium australafricanum]MCA6104407.1 hypothetical protein [Bradyrhizobium australafricanum]
MAADLSDRLVEDWDVIGGNLSLHEANSPSFRNLVQHSVNRFVTRVAASQIWISPSSAVTRDEFR